jgi:hypothetical protein
VADPSTWAILMVVAFFALLMIGIPVAVSLATVGFVHLEPAHAQVVAQQLAQCRVVIDDKHARRGGSFHIAASLLPVPQATGRRETQ